MKKINITEDFITEYNEALVNKDKEVIFYATDSILVAYGKENSLDLNYVKKNKIPTIQLYSPCGTCVCLENDISILSFSNCPTFYSLQFLEDLKCFLKNHNIDSTIENNDLIIVSGKSKFKIASFCIGNFNNKCVEAVHISYSMNEDLINSICTKNQVKKPKGLKDFNIDYNELNNFITSFAEQHELV